MSLRWFSKNNIGKRIKGALKVFNSVTTEVLMLYNFPLVNINGLPGPMLIFADPLGWPG